MYRVVCKPSGWGSAVMVARIDEGLTQEALAERAGVSNATVQRAEAGRGIRLFNAQAIADALGRTLRDLFSIEPRHGNQLKGESA